MSETSGGGRYFQPIQEPGDFEVVATADTSEVKPKRSPRKRHDVHADKSATKRKAPRAAAERHDSVVTGHIDGFGPNPFRSVAPAGYRVYWVTKEDRERHFMRPWRPAKWFEDDVQVAFQPLDAKKGDVIRWKDHTCMLAPIDKDDAYRALDPNRRRHAELMNLLRDRAIEGAGIDADSQGNTAHLAHRGSIKQFQAEVNVSAFTTE